MSSPRGISAYVPCYNNEATLEASILSVKAQTIAIDDLFVIDDGSTDRSADVARRCGARVIGFSANRGRGAVRARAMEEARHDLVMCCDATNVVDERFLEKALPWLDDSRVAAVFGRLTQPPARTLAERWRGRHLLKLGVLHQVTHGAAFATYGAVVRAPAVRTVGGYNSQLRHTEDGDLGRRLLAAHFDVICDPHLEVTSIASNTLAQVLERYWRWYAGQDERVSWRGYWQTVGYSIKGMAADDLRAGDPLSVPVSLLTPHYQFWRSWARRRRRAAEQRSATRA